MISKTTQILKEVSARGKEAFKKHEIKFSVGLAVFVFAIILIYPASTADKAEYYESRTTVLVPTSNVISIELNETAELPIENAAIIAAPNTIAK